MSESRPEVSWLMIEPGWLVLGSDGSRLGKVHEVIGDSGEDIFNGIAVSPGLLRSSRYVPAERVSGIREGRVVIDVDRSAFARLDQHGKAPPSAQIVPPDRNP